MSDRQGVEIDYCPTCRGVWLDRGELDKIIERSVPAAAPPAAPRESYGGPRDGYGGSRESYGDDRSPRHKKRGSFLGDIFDF